MNPCFWCEVYQASRGYFRDGPEDSTNAGPEGLSPIDRMALTGVVRAAHKAMDEIQASGSCPGLRQTASGELICSSLWRLVELEHKYAGNDVLVEHEFLDDDESGSN